MVKERNGKRQFEKMSRWNSLEDSIITPNNANAKYADKIGSGNKSLFITYFKRDGKIFPINRFEKLDTPVMLEDLSRLTMRDTESNYWLEINEDKSKIRVYKEVSNEN